MGNQMLHLSCRRVGISSRVFHNVSRYQGRQRVANRAFSQTAKVGDDIKDDHESGPRIVRVVSQRQSLVRNTASSANYYPTVAGETIPGELAKDIKSYVQGLQDGSLRKTSSKDPYRSRIKSQNEHRIKKTIHDHSVSTASDVVLERKPSSLSPRQFSIISPDPKRTTKEQVLQLISRRARMTQARYFANFSNVSAEEAIVILVTPAFAKWLEDDEGFIKKVLDCFTYYHVDKKPNYVVVVGAVVDGLAPSPHEVPIAERVGPLEGFSFLHGLRSQLLKPENVWKPESFRNDTTSPEKLSHLIISGKNRRKPGEESLATTMSLPLANTLFVNGKHSTLEISQWTRRHEGEYKCIQTANKQYQHIKAFHHENTMIPPIFVPAVPLTLPRPIANGLGNIIRQLSFGPEDTDNRPASSELETQVTRYMEFSKLHTNIGVWALIYRKELLNPNLKATTLEKTEDLESTWGDDDKNLRFIGTQIALGAILCRVVSGGGGWGAKQGLLSLDPQLTYEDIASARFDYTPHRIEEGQDSTLGNLARRGDHIQFFTINPNKLNESEPPMDNPASDEVSKVDSSISADKKLRSKLITLEPRKNQLNLSEATDLSWSRRTIFGVVPSTIDKLPKSDIASASNASDETLPFLSFRKGEFGAVSESGIYLHSSHQKQLNANTYEHINTKIDMPYSYIYRDQPGITPKGTGEYKKKMHSLQKKFPEKSPDVAGEAIKTSFSEITARFMIMTGRFPTKEEEKELFAQLNIDPQKDFTHAIEKFFQIRKQRVGHTRWPKYSPEPEPKKEFSVRKIVAPIKELSIKFHYSNKREDWSPSKSFS
ncbi:hypothetical protein sscle_04g037790 [Sclerotinia sclerotiorum 1980 UF-70]|uniref:Uncharacterized protein n=1 Tax=Sclerotinia sclerotiorum (strain ATCC 18683 / 1980 / Ss-1) TaxID=665079 RepID=A0A1D9Q2C1_SCLS1|nr:hypothetical protein sscle_04g037790 [Sclerotinia sclerotiorum 1980 UF-70]